MKIVNVDFEEMPVLKCIEVLFRASEKDEQVNELMERIARYEPERLAFMEDDGNVRVIDAKRIISVSVSKKNVTIITDKE
ncbi:MAG: hypothetical protein IJ736_11875, partial [Firmicutes bacterium]|nr:hypothetical protein [Bacillota bacterium]